MWITVIIPFPIGFTCSVKERPLFEFLSQLPDEWIDIEQEDGMVIVRAANSTTAFKYLLESPPIVPGGSSAHDLFALIKEMDSEDLRWQELPDDLIAGMKICSSYTSEDPANRQYFVVSVHDEEVLACDNTQALLYRLKKPVDGRFIIAPPPVYALRRFEANYFGPYQLDSYCVNYGWTLFRGANVLLSVRNLPSIEQKYFLKNPHLHERIISFFPRDEDGTFIRLPKELSKVLKRFSRLLRSQGRCSHLDRCVTLELTQDQITCSAYRTEGGSADETIVAWQQESIPLGDGPEEGFRIYLDPDALIQGMKDTGTACYIYEDRLILVSDNFRYLLLLRGKKEPL